MWRGSIDLAAMDRRSSGVTVTLTLRSFRVSVSIWDLKNELALRLAREVDLIDLAAASTVMQAQVVTRGERLFCSDSAYCETFEDRVLSAYARLNEGRRDILRDIRKRGSVYGR
jgi:hypothetical protein